MQMHKVNLSILQDLINHNYVKILNLDLIILNLNSLYYIIPPYQMMFFLIWFLKSCNNNVQNDVKLDF